MPFTLERVFLHLPMDRMTRRVNFRPYRHRLLISGALLSVIVLQAEGSPSSTVTSGPAAHVQSRTSLFSHLHAPARIWCCTHALQAAIAVSYSHGKTSAPSVIWSGSQWIVCSPENWKAPPLSSNSGISRLSASIPVLLLPRKLATLVPDSRGRVGVAARLTHPPFGP